jgi:hypothetical protein
MLQSVLPFPESRFPRIYFRPGQLDYGRINMTHERRRIGMRLNHKVTNGAVLAASFFCGL